MKRTIRGILIASLLIFFSAEYSMALNLKDAPQVGLAFLVNLSIHESGHYIMANMVGAEGNSLSFFKREGKSFFFGLSTVSKIESKFKPSYHLAGEVATSLTFEMALDIYRRSNTPFNKALLFFSMTDFFWYTVYSFYLAPQDNDMFDPVGLSKTTGISRDMIFLVALTQSSLNALRVYTGEDRIIPYYMLDRDFIGYGIRFRF